MLTNMDKAVRGVAANGPVCVGLDTESATCHHRHRQDGGENVVARSTVR